MIRRYEDPQHNEDKMFNFFLDKGQFRGAIVHGTAMIREMKENHNLGILETLILGQSYLAGALLTSNLKGGDRVAFDVKCNGPVEGIFVESNYDGHVRGYLKNDNIPLDKELESFDTSPFIGKGTLSFTKYVSEDSQPFTGTVELQYGSIAKDLAYYFTQSEQLPTALELSILFDKEGNVSSAGGLLIQSMPGTSQERLDEITSLLFDKISIAKQMANGEDVVNILFEDFKHFSPQIIGNKPIEFFCPCSKDRFGSFLKSLPKKDKKEISTQGPFPLVLNCHNCGSEYSFSKEELKEIL
ncbi:Hsp33 family molecular chaperone HslO [Spirochaeta cellobiosiphila]|uniref:Hsp33 family molecular chaperone HslO n=1 Tax=Spirochaeta cellobiosiphila TaxID=504483 RepID=UPI00048ADEB8|nr:Hsp33 family molecular chaperone HslO [Spirochaeta cellobiosiphila]